MKSRHPSHALALLATVVVIGTLPTGSAMAETAVPPPEVLVLAMPATAKYVPEKTGTDQYTQKISLEGLRGEWVSLQILIKEISNVSRLENVNAIPSDLDMVDGDATIQADGAYTLYREWFLDVREPSGAGLAVQNHLREPGHYPDPLIPFKDPFKPGDVPVAAPFTLNQDPGYAVIWVDLFIPRDATPGHYSGNVKVEWTEFDLNGNAGEADSRYVDIDLQVWELDIPRERNVATAFGISDGAIRSYHGGPDPAATSEDYNEIVRTYHKVLHDHRMDLTYQRGPVSFQFDDDGALLPVDWTAYDAFLQPRIDGTYFDDTVGIARFASGMFEPGGGTNGWTDEQYKAAARAYVEHLDEKGWLDRMWTYSTDEPWLNGGAETWARVIREAGLLHEASDLWEGHVLVTGPMYEGAEEVVDIWCPVNAMYDKWFWVRDDYAGRGDYDEHLANNGELWFYNCNANFPPFPGYDIDTTIGYEPRILKWGSWFEKATGFLHWHTNIWHYVEPWLEWRSTDAFGDVFARHGDGMLMYPGDSDGYHVDVQGNPIPTGIPEWLHIDGPIMSFRVKQIRDGLEDWELFIMAEKAGLGDWLQTEIGRAYTRFGDFFELDCSKEYYYCPSKGEPWTLDENVLLDVRSRVARKLLFTMYPDRYEDPDAVVIPEVSDDPIVEPVPDIIEPVDVTTDVLKDSDKGGCSSSGPASLPGALLPLVVLLSGLLLIRRRNRA